MSIISIIVPDNIVIIDGMGVNVPDLATLLPDHIHAIQITGPDAVVEFDNGVPNATDGLAGEFQAAIDAAQAILDAPPPEPTLSELKDITCQEIDSQKDALLSAGVTYQSKNFDLDSGSQVKWVSIFNMANHAISQSVSFSQDIIATDNSQLNLNETTAVEFALAAAARTSQIILAARNHKDAILAKTTKSAVQNYDYSGQWTT